MECSVTPDNNCNSNQLKQLRFSINHSYITKYGKYKTLTVNGKVLYIDFIFGLLHIMRSGLMFPENAGTCNNKAADHLASMAMPFGEI